MTCSQIGDANFQRVSGGTGNDVLAFAGAITLVDTDFRKVSEVEGIRLGNGATSLTLGAIAARAIDGLGNSLIAIDGTAAHLRPGDDQCCSAGAARCR